MRLTHRRPLALCAAAALALAAPAVAAAHGSGHGTAMATTTARGCAAIKRIVVIYEENHSFDNLYGGWEGVNGLRRADRRPHDAGQPGRHALHVPAAERREPGDAAAQRDVHDTTTATPFDSHFTNKPFHDRRRSSRRPRRRARRPASSPPTACSDPTGLPGGCTRDLVHRYYQEQYQLNGGKQNRYVTGSDAVGLTQGYYDTRALPIYKYLHTARPSRLRDRRRLLPGGLRRLVPQPPVADRRGDADVARTRDNTAAPTTCTPWSTPTGCRTNYPLYTSPAGTRSRTPR